MNFNNFTIKAQETVQQAVQLVTQNNQQAIEPVHLLKAVIMTGESISNFLFQKLGVNKRQINMFPSNRLFWLFIPKRAVLLRF